MEEKARMLGLARAWTSAPEDRFLLFLPGQTGSEGELHFYVHGHQRGCALHAMLAFYYHSMFDVLPHWLAIMAIAIPADIDDSITTRFEVASKGMARTLKM